MPQYIRFPRQGGCYFFTVNTHLRQPLLCQDEVRHALRQSINLVREKHPFEIHAWVLLPDHLHCIWQLPPRDEDYSKRWSWIKRLVSQEIPHITYDPKLITQSKYKRRESTLWQRRFWEHEIRDQHDFNRHMDYIHWNPVKHGLVDRVVDWPYSTFHRYVREGVYSVDWCGGEK